ncbi:MAG: prephenate dehydrogenase/arogenate dehydrogenase family protein [Nanoarchaeota archaeon]|nr:prephenate dehydrogenase/arogenate dehydrogenase family protein [Nanoarchaeota archaeon]
MEKNADEKINIGIIGGKGKFGSWLDNFFTQKGFNVSVSDIGTELTNMKLVEKNDVVVFSVPIQMTEQIIESVVPFSKEGQLWMDVTSVKTHAVEAMLKSKAEVVGLHPMFAPTIETKNRQAVIVCDARTKKWKGWIETILSKEGAKVKETTHEKHDKMMAIIQGMTHFSLISLGFAFKQMGLDIDESLEYTSPIYKMRMNMVGRLLNQNPELYADIEIMNPETQEALRAYIDSFMKLYMIVKDGDRERFIDYFKEASEFLGDFKEKATEESNFLIQKVVEKHNRQNAKKNEPTGDADE